MTKKITVKQITKMVMERMNLSEAPVDDFLASTDKPLPDFVSTLKQVSADDEFRKVAGAGQADGNPQDEVVTVERTQAKAIDLLPTQAEIGMSNSLADQMTNQYNAAKTALGLVNDPIIMPSADNPPPAILVFNGKYILDGHHRWSQVAMMNPDGEVAIDNMTSPNIKDNEQALKVMQMAIGAKAGKVVTKPFEGQNLMKATDQAVRAYVIENIEDEVLNLLVEAKKISEPNKDAAANYIVENFKLVKKNPGPFSREKSMPQAGKSGVSQDDVNSALAAGEINFIQPDKGDAANRKDDLIPEGIKNKWKKLIK